MRSVSNFLHLKVNWKKKMYLYVNSTTQSCPSKIFNSFLIEDFFPNAIGVTDSGGAPLAANISTNFRKKFETALVGYSEASGKLIHEKNLKSKISWHCPF